MNDQTPTTEAKQLEALTEPAGMKVQELQIKVRQMKADQENFLPMWRKVLSMKRALGDFEKAQPEDVDETVKFLCDYIIEPAANAEKIALLNRLKESELMAVFDRIMRGDTVPPANGGA